MPRVQAVSSKPIRIWGLLALLLLLFQSVTLAHSHDDPASGLDSCEICLHAQLTDDLVLPATLPVHARPAATVSLHLYRAPLVTGARFSHSPRAPPISL
mgnify:CR=1 FL=1